MRAGGAATFAIVGYLVNGFAPLVNAIAWLKYFSPFLRTMVERRFPRPPHARIRRVWSAGRTRRLRPLPDVGHLVPITTATASEATTLGFRFVHPRVRRRAAASGLSSATGASENPSRTYRKSGGLRY